MAAMKESESARKSEKLNIWLTPEQAAWLKSKKNISETVRGLVVEAMNLERLAESVKAGTKQSSKKKPAAKPKRT